MTRRQRFRRIPPSLWLFPVLVLVVAGVLTGLNLNGSSIGMLSGAGADDPSLVAGTPRPVRSDEWQVATPVQVGNVHKGFPVHAWLGLTDTDFRVTSLNPPTASWLAIFEPHTWPEFILPADRGFDARWWSYLVVPLIGVFALLMALRVSTSVSIALAFVVALSPLGAWWTSPPPGLIVGYLCGAGTAFLLGAGAKKPIQRLAGGAVAGALVCAAFLVLYPPWFVAAGLVVAAVVAGTLRDRGTRFGLCLGALLVMVVIAGSVMAGWAYQSKAALAAVVGTYYPGQRVSEAGQGLASVLFSAPLNWSMSVPDVAFRSDLTMSQSEAAAPWLPIPVVVVLVAILLAAAVSARRVGVGVDSASGHRRNTHPAQPGARYSLQCWHRAWRRTARGPRGWSTEMAVAVVGSALTGYCAGTVRHSHRLVGLGIARRADGVGANGHSRRVSGGGMSGRARLPSSARG